MVQAPIKLALVTGGPPKRMSLGAVLHMLYLFLPRLFVTLPFSIFWNHLLMRWRSPIVNVVGRPFYSDYVAKLSQFYLGRASVAEARLLFNRTQAYSLTYGGPHFKGCRDWVQYVKVNGTAGRWIAPPGSKRSEDDCVIFYIHGGGFVLDTGGNAQIFFLKLAKLLNKRSVATSVFSLDYELAPERMYPSQLIETLAAYHHLVNDLGIPEDRICIAGDSAGGNLAEAFLLHLARPNPAISVPASLGPTPKRPGSALLISPFHKLVSHLPSRKANEQYDLIDNGGSFSAALDYIGVPHPDGRIHVPSFNPIHLFTFPNPTAPRGLVKSAKGFTAEKEGKGIALLSSPYVNPSVCEDLEWWKEACPEDGATMVTWGGKEIFSDDVVELVATLNKAGVAPTPLCKPFGVHDWILFDYFIPGFYQTNSNGPDSQLNWGLHSVADFLQEHNDRRPRQAAYEKISAQKKLAAAKAAAKVEEVVVAPKVAGEVEGSVVLVEPVVEEKEEVVKRKVVKSKK